MKLFKKSDSVNSIKSEIEQLENDVDRYEKAKQELIEKREFNQSLMLDLLKRSIADQDAKLEQDAREMQRELQLLDAKEQALQELINSALAELEELETRTRTVKESEIESEIFSLQRERKETIEACKKLAVNVIIKYSEIVNIRPSDFCVDMLLHGHNQKIEFNNYVESLKNGRGIVDTVEYKISELKREKTKLDQQAIRNDQKYRRVA